MEVWCCAQGGEKKVISTFHVTFRQERTRKGKVIWRSLTPSTLLLTHKKIVNCCFSFLPARKYPSAAEKGMRFPSSSLAALPIGEGGKAAPEQEVQRGKKRLSWQGKCWQHQSLPMPSVKKKANNKADFNKQEIKTSASGLC